MTTPSSIGAPVSAEYSPSTRRLVPLPVFGMTWTLRVPICWAAIAAV